MDGFFVSFTQPRISNFIQKNFEGLQLNIVGLRKVKEFDGSELPEKDLAAFCV